MCPAFCKTPPLARALRIQVQVNSPRTNRRANLRWLRGTAAAPIGSALELLAVLQCEVTSNESYGCVSC